MAPLGTIWDANRRVDDVMWHPRHAGAVIVVAEVALGAQF
jgi:hypothetical protein